MKRPTRSPSSNARYTLPSTDGGGRRAPEPIVRGGAAAEHQVEPADRASAPKPDGMTGTVFAGRYRLEKKIGRGGMGSVYVATQLAVDRLVAIKVLDNAGDDPVLVQRFQREARVIAQLHHPHVVNLIDFGESEDGRLYLVMEYIDGGSLKDLLAREVRLDARRVVNIGRQIVEALVVAHEIGVIHRDLKPDNVMLTEVAGRPDYVKVLDFGIAKVKKSDPGQQETVQTLAGLIVGSLRYISPEQVDSGEITPQTDFYPLGGILYEMLTGKRVFDYPSPADCAIAHLTEAPKPPRVDGVQLEGPLPDFIMQCLEKDPRRRPASAKVALAMLEACANAPLSSSDKTVLVQAPEAFLAAAGGRPQEGPASTPPPPAAARFTPEPPPVAAPAVPPPAAAPARVGADAPAAALGEATSTVTARALDCALDTPKKLIEMAPGAAGVADTALRPRVPTGLGGYEIVAGATGMRPRADELAQTPSQPGGVRLMAPQGPPRARTNPVVMVLALLGLAAVGAAIFVFAIHPAMTRTTPAPVESRPVEAAHEETSIAAETAPMEGSGEPESAEGPSFTVVAPEPVPVDSVRVTTEVEGVAVFQGGSRLGTTPLLVTWGASEKPPEVRLQKVGYNDALVQLTDEERGRERAVVMTKAGSPP